MKRSVHCRKTDHIMDFLTPSDQPAEAAPDGAASSRQEPLLLLIGRDSRLPAACHGLCELLDYEMLAIADAETLVETLRRRRPAAVVCEDELIGITSWFVLARLAQSGCNPDVVVEARAHDPDLRAAFDSCGDLLGLTHVTTLSRRLTVDDVARLLASASLRANRPGLIQLRH
jgi:hypothetical protein